MTTNDYAAFLRRRYDERAEEAASMAPISVTEWKARKDREAWRGRYATHGVDRPPARAPRWTWWGLAAVAVANVLLALAGG